METENTVDQKAGNQQNTADAEKTFVIPDDAQVADLIPDDAQVAASVEGFIRGLHEADVALNRSIALYAPVVDIGITSMASRIAQTAQMAGAAEAALAHSINSSGALRALQDFDTQHKKTSTALAKLMQGAFAPPVLPPTALLVNDIAARYAEVSNIAQESINHTARRIKDLMMPKFDLGLSELFRSSARIDELVKMALPAWDVPKFPEIVLPKMPRYDFQIPKYHFPDLFAPLDATKFFRDFVENSKRAKEAFEESEYSFLENFITADFAFYLGSIDAAHREAELAECMWRVTRSPEFRKSLKLVFSCHPVLAVRWPAISEGLSSHRRGKFHSSVRTFFPDIEGVYTDLMMARGEIKRHNGRNYALKPDGNFLTIMNGGRSRKLALTGLGPKLDHCAPADDPSLEVVTERFLRQLLSSRNNTLHGESASAGNMEFSTRLVWGLYVIGFVAAVELNARASFVSSMPLTEARRQAERRLEDAHLFVPREAFTTIQ